MDTGVQLRFDDLACTFEKLEKNRNEMIKAKKRQNWQIQSAVAGNKILGEI